MKIVITGFGGFHNNPNNPTQDILNLLPKSIYGNEIIPVELPVVYNKSFNKLQEVIDKEKPELVICLGLSQRAVGIAVERVAINLIDVSIPDNDGNLIQGEPIKQDGKNAYFSTLPIKKIVENIKEKNTNAYISNTAGLYVCNNIMYNLLYYIDKNNLNIKGGFIHVPLTHDYNKDKNYFSLGIDEILEGIIDSIKACLNQKEDYLWK